MLRVASLSFWHVHAWDYLNQALEHPQVTPVAAWDENAERGAAEAQKAGLTFYANLDELLAQPDIDGVIVDTPSSMHREVMVAAARAGKHIFTEKVLATTLRDADEILTEVARHGVKLTVSLPRLNAGYTQAILQIIASGRLGTLTQARVRLSHGGSLPYEGAPDGWLPTHFYNLAETGGGALIDLGCHPMYLTRLFLGMPESVSATYGYITGREVEDHAVAVLKYASGAQGIVEAGFVNRRSPFSVEVHGTDGSLLFGTPAEQLLVGFGDTNDWEQIALPPDLPSAFDQWVTHIAEGTTADQNIAIARDLTRLMEASNLSAAAGRSVRIDELVP